MIDVFDFFSGCGGTSCGLSDEGLNIKFALDIDEVAISTFKENFPYAKVLTSNIQEIEPENLSSIIGERNNPILFCGCAPCQPFSKQNKKKYENDPRKNLLMEFSRFIGYWEPEYVLVENVPGMQKIRSNGPFYEFLKILDDLKYQYSFDVLPAADFGVPQRRERLVLLASKLGTISLPKATHGPKAGTPYSTVREWISDLTAISAGETCNQDSEHRAAKLSEINLRRIKQTPEGGGREFWSPDLQLKCHQNYKGHTDVYGRLHWDKPASGLTTRCISLSNGRFGHPSQNRAISIREAACLQTFPRTYRFKGNMASKARQIGNAVPPLMAKEIGKSIKNHFLSLKTFE
ncbi:DNA cytosine methyltransferase [Cellvibrio sp. UBA7661]|uniref:DNA cytosine methyltransferase n=1 Tax=Cellvibrio sp. UBA7661 TaxID=1946311 RepID=UPI002F3554C9